MSTSKRFSVTLEAVDEEALAALAVRLGKDRAVLAREILKRAILADARGQETPSIPTPEQLADLSPRALKALADGLVPWQLDAKEALKAITAALRGPFGSVVRRSRDTIVPATIQSQELKD